MYPYNINSRVKREVSAQLNKPKPPMNNMPGDNIPPDNEHMPEDNKGCMPKPNQSAANKYILEMLKTALADEAADANYYDRLANMITNPEDSKLVHKIHHDENKHYNIIKNIYYELTGEKIDDVEYEVKPLSTELCQNFADSIISELEAVEFYRKLLFAFLNVEIRDWMTEIMTDEQAHAQIMNYLFSKYHKC